MSANDPRPTHPSGAQAGSARIAATLQAARRDQEVVLVEAASELRVSVTDLAALEQRDDASILASVPAMANLRLYARHLGLDPEVMLTAAARATREHAGVGAAAREASAPAHTDEQSAPVREAAAADPEAAASATEALPTHDEEPPGPRRRRPSPVALLTVLGLFAAVIVAVAAVAVGGQQGLDSPLELTEPQDGGDTQGTTEADDRSIDEEELDRALEEGVRDSPSPSDEEATDSAQDPEAEADAEADAAEPSEEPAIPGRPPEETAVQVLDGAGDPEATEEVVTVLEDLGYQVAAVGAARNASATTSVFFTEGWAAEAEGLAARDERFTARDGNPGFSEEIHLHVVVGTDWSD